MKSGRYVTSSSNSRIRVLAAQLVGASWCYAMGDDSLEQAIDRDEAFRRYAAIGCTLKDYRVCDKTFEFCSHRYDRGVAEPVAIGKTLFRLLCQHEPSVELHEQFLFEARHSEFLTSIVRGLELVHWLGPDRG
jgi:hypothetical protein